MPIRVSIDRQRGLITTVISGAITPADLVAAYERIFADPDFRPGLDSLWDMRDARLAAFTTEHIRQTSEYILSQAARRGSGYKSALVASADLQFGLARMYEVFTERLPAEVGVFRDIDDALRWLAEGRN